MTERTSDEDDMADYTDDHQDAPRSGAADKVRDGGRSIDEMTPDVQTDPDQEPPD